LKKSIILICAILLGVAALGFAQDDDMNLSDSNRVDSNRVDSSRVDSSRAIFIGIGPEINMNSREGFAGGIPINIDYQLPISALPLALGLTITMSSNFSDTTVAETTGLFRWYFMGMNHSGFFAQVDLGMHILTERNVSLTLFNGGIRAGFRLPLGDFFYVDPHGRFGYPFFIGAGVLGGMRFMPSNSPNINTTSNATSYTNGSSGTEE